MILLLRCLTADCNLGYYTGGACKMLDSLNGTKIRSMTQLATEVFETTKDDTYLRFRCAPPLAAAFSTHMRSLG